MSADGEGHGAGEGEGQREGEVAGEGDGGGEHGGEEEEDAVRRHVAVLSGRAQKKWNELDVDGSEELDGEEVLVLAEWVWSSFRPGQVITAQERVQEATKLLRRCDTNENGKIDMGEFGQYYEKICAEMFR